MVKRIRLKRSKTDSADASIAASSPSVSGCQRSANGSAGAGAGVGSGRLNNNNNKSKQKKKFIPRLLRSKSAPSATNENEYDDGQQTESIRSYENQSTTDGGIIGSSSSVRPSMLAAAAVEAVDDGTPSSSPYNDLQRVIAMMNDERHLVAYDLFVDVKRRLDETSRVGAAAAAATIIANNASSQNYQNAWAFLQERQQEFQALENRAKLFTAAKENLAVDDDWIHAQTLFGISTSYRREPDNSLSVKIEGELHGIPLFEQLVVLREVDLYDTWAPFMSKSVKLAQLDKLDVVAWYIVGMPMFGLTRDACYRAVGCDCMQENGSVLLVAVGLNDTEEHGVKNALNAGVHGNDDGTSQSEQNNVPQHQTATASDSNLVDTTNSTFLARDAILETLEIPPIPQGMGRGRMTIRNFAASIDILSPTGARTKMVVNVDPNLQLIPQFMMDFCMKRMCGILLSRLQATARKVVHNPVKNAHARRMREDVLFYRDWLLPKFQTYCNEFGWNMPKVGAFEIDLEAEGMGWIDTKNVENSIHLATSQQQQCQLDGLESVSSHGSTSNNSSIRSPISFLRFRRGETQEEKIAAARLRAAKLVQPEPFAQSKVQRLNQLKAAKIRAEERLRARTIGASPLDSFSSHGSTQTLAPDSGVRYFAMFSFSLSIHLALALLRGHICEWTSLVSNERLNYTLVLFQAISLWALLNSTVVYAFNNVDFGQKKLVSNMDYGKKLFITGVRHISLLTSVAIATISCAYDLATKGVFQLCSVEYIDLRKLLTALPVSVETVNNLGNLFNTIKESRFWAWSAWAISNVYSYAKMPLDNTATAASLAVNDFVSCVFPANLKVCESNDSDQWGSRALSISSYMTLRIGVFVITLMLLGHKVLPKCHKKLDTKTRGIASTPGHSETKSYPVGEPRRRLNTMEVISE